MLRSNARFFGSLLAIADSILIFGAFLLVFWLRLGPEPTRDFFGLSFLIAAGGLPGWHVLLRYVGAYSSMRMASAWVIARQISFAVVAFALGQFALLYLAKIDFSRAVTVFYPLVAGVFVFVLRLAIKYLLGRLRRGGYNYRNVLLVGANRSSLGYAMRVRTNLGWGLRVRGVLLADNQTLPKDWPALFPVLGKAEDLSTLLLSEPIDRVIFSLNNDNLDNLPNYLAICEELGIEAVLMPPSFEQLQIARIHVENFFGMPVVNYTTTPAQHVQLALKRVLDVVATSIGLFFLAPLFFVLIVAIKLDSPGPVFFRQYRSGIRGRRFNCYKFRSMYIDAEARLAELKAQNEMSGPVFKMKNDPRITRVGRIIRKYSLDELPQLFNVLRGDMSLVGPRPPLPAEVAEYEPWQRRRLSMKPGITCTWQVSGRNDISFEQWMRLDLEYIDNWNLALDVKLLLKTIPAVIKGTGV
jgi:exopolysaccharide biosynthesis polyprenyl glycosylphosphotransferase